MIRLARADDTLPIANMLKRMTIEIMPEYATEDDDVYWEVIREAIADDNTYVYVDDGYRGFFIIVDDTDPTTPDYHRYVNTKIYIYPEYRKTRIYKDFWDRLYEDFPEGDIIGVTETNSEHIPVLEKRHERIANVYKVNRRNRWELEQQ